MTADTLRQAAERIRFRERPESPWIAVAALLESDAAMCEECQLDETVAAVESVAVARAYLGESA